MHGSPSPFEHDLPPGFQYRQNFISEVEEHALLEAIATVAFSEFEMRGVVARRRVAFFGQSYDRATAGPLPEFLLPHGSFVPSSIGGLPPTVGVVVEKRGTDKG